MKIIGPHDHRAIAHPKSALSWENASRDARQARPGSNLKIIAGPHDGFNSVGAAATRDKQLSFSLARCRLHISPMLHRRKIKTRPAAFGAHIARPDTRFWPAAAIDRSWVRPARIRNLGFRPFCSAARAETLQHRLLLRSHHVISGPTTPVTVHGP